MHLAIAYNNNELVQELVEAKANVNQRAIGKDTTYFFTISNEKLDKNWFQEVFSCPETNKDNILLAIQIMKVLPIWASFHCPGQPAAPMKPFTTYCWIMGQIQTYKTHLEI